MDFLNQLSQGVVNGVNAGNNYMQQLSALQNQSQPDITYNPNPSTNIPYSSHSMSDARMGNQYVANPTSPQFLGIDPARFGFPPDGPMNGNIPLIGKVGAPNSISLYHQGNYNGPGAGIDSIGGRLGSHYGGTVGIDNGKVFANMNHNGQAIDPLSALRQLLGF